MIFLHFDVLTDETACRGDILVFSALFYCF